MDHERQSNNNNRPQRIPFADRLPPTARNHFVACAGEFIGTFFFLFFALSGTQVANTSRDARDEGCSSSELSRLMYISVVFGLSLAVNAWVWFRVSGGLFNPAVSSPIAFSVRCRANCTTGYPDAVPRRSP